MMINDTFESSKELPDEALQIQNTVQKLRLPNSASRLLSIIETEEGKVDLAANIRQLLLESFALIPEFPIMERLPFLKINMQTDDLKILDKALAPIRRQLAVSLQQLVLLNIQRKEAKLGYMEAFRSVSAELKKAMYEWVALPEIKALGNTPRTLLWKALVQDVARAPQEFLLQSWFSKGYTLQQLQQHKIEHSIFLTSEQQKGTTDQIEQLFYQRYEVLEQELRASIGRITNLHLDSSEAVKDVSSKKEPFAGYHAQSKKKKLLDRIASLDKDITLCIDVLSDAIETGSVIPDVVYEHQFEDKKLRIELLNEGNRQLHTLGQSVSTRYLGVVLSFLDTEESVATKQHELIVFHQNTQVSFRGARSATTELLSPTRLGTLFSSAVLGGDTHVLHNAELSFLSYANSLVDAPGGEAFLREVLLPALQELVLQYVDASQLREKMLGKEEAVSEPDDTLVTEEIVSLEEDPQVLTKELPPISEFNGQKLLYDNQQQKLYMVIPLREGLHRGEKSQRLYQELVGAELPSGYHLYEIESKRKSLRWNEVLQILRKYFLLEEQPQGSTSHIIMKRHVGGEEFTGTVKKAGDAPFGTISSALNQLCIPEPLFWALAERRKHVKPFLTSKNIMQVADSYAQDAKRYALHTAS